MLEGVLEDDETFAYIATLDACEACRAKGKAAPDDTCATCDQWTNEAVWEKANPNLPYGTPKLEDMRKLALDAAKKAGDIDGLPPRPAGLPEGEQFALLRNWLELGLTRLEIEAVKARGVGQLLDQLARTVDGVRPPDLESVSSIFPDTEA